jgi:TaqI-like C-terminal specificity domain
MKPLEEWIDARSGKKVGLRHREDHGRCWWELRSCAYYDTFHKPKIIYQEIQYHCRYALDTNGLYANNKTFLLPSEDLALLSILNSPLMWWFNWRFLPHMKDEALTPVAIKMERLPIATLNASSGDVLLPSVSSLMKAARVRHEVFKSISDWLRTEFELDEAVGALGEPQRLDAEAFRTVEVS